MTLKELKEELKQLEFQLTEGCGNFGCVIKQPVGQGTNGGCRCTPSQLAKRLEWVAKEIRSEHQGFAWH